MTRTLKEAVTKALKMLEAGDPVEAVSALDLALNLRMPPDTRKLLSEAKAEAETGSTTTAETLLNTL